MEKRFGGSKPAAPKSPVDALQETEAVIDTQSGLDAPDQTNKAALESTTTFDRPDDDDASAASMLLSEDEPPRPAHKPAGKPRPLAPKNAQDTDDAVLARDAGAPAAGDQTAVFTNVPAASSGASPAPVAPPNRRSRPRPRVRRGPPRAVDRRTRKSCRKPAPWAITSS